MHLTQRTLTRSFWVLWNALLSVTKHLVGSFSQKNPVDFLVAKIVPHGNSYTLHLFYTVQCCNQGIHVLFYNNIRINDFMRSSLRGVSSSNFCSNMTMWFCVFSVFNANSPCDAQYICFSFFIFCKRSKMNIITHKETTMEALPDPIRIKSHESWFTADALITGVMDVAFAVQVACVLWAAVHQYLESSQRRWKRKMATRRVWNKMARCRRKRTTWRRDHASHSLC